MVVQLGAIELDGVAVVVKALKLSLAPRSSAVRAFLEPFVAESVIKDLVGTVNPGFVMNLLWLEIAVIGKA